MGAVVNDYEIGKDVVYNLDALGHLPSKFVNGCLDLKLMQSHICIGQAEYPDSRSQQLRVFYVLQRTRLYSCRMIWLPSCWQVVSLSQSFLSPAKQFLTK